MEYRDSGVIPEDKELGALLLDVGISLLQAGASCSRIRSTMTRFAVGFDYTPHITIGSKSVSLTLNNKDGKALSNGIRSSSIHGIDFNLISTISGLSSKAAEKQLTIQQLEKELNNSRAPGQYHRIIVLFFVSLAGAAFCFNFGGTYLEMIITFGATFCGLFVKQQMTKYHFNPYICTYAAATVASLFVAVLHTTGLTLPPLNAFATCVLFLVPGVLFINCVTDLIDGNTMNGLVKGISALIYALAIAFGLLTTILIFNLNR